MSGHRLGDDDGPHDKPLPSRSPPRRYEGHRRDSHMHDGQNGSMVKGDDGATRWRRRPSPDYGRGREAERDRMRLTPERPLDGCDRDNGWDRNRGDRGGGSASGYGGRNTNYSVGGRDDFFEQRRKERQASGATIWPASPRAPYESDDDHHRSGKKSKKHKPTKRSKHRHDYPQSESDSEGDLRHKKKHKSSRHKSRKGRDKDRRHSRHHRSLSLERERRRRRSQSGSAPPIPPNEADADAWVEREPATDPANGATAVLRRQSLPATAPPPRPSAPKQPSTDTESETSESDAEDVVGPMPYNPVTGKAMDPKEFGRALRPGEGSAMAAYIEAGQRIPRRGEIGLVGTEIEKYEKAGFVMSGSRHRRMNAVRIRKENQVISAEEKRGILKMQAEEKAKREGQIVASFRELVDTKLQQQDHGRR